MKKTVFKKIFLLSQLALLLTACNKFNNVNPNVPASVNPGVMLPQVFYNISNTLVNNAFELNNELMQYTCMNNTITEVQRFKLQPANSNGIWGLYNRVRDLDDIVGISKSNTDLQNYAAIAQIIRVFIFSQLTDTYGDIPYTQAVTAADSAIYSPKYDNQQDIYPDLLAKLKSAAAMIDVSKGLSLGGDVIFNGQMAKWQKFANSLRLRLLMRVSAKYPPAIQEITDMLSNPSNYPMMESNDDNFLYRYGGSLPDVFPLALSNLQDFTFKYKSVSAFIVDSLKKFGDSRLFQYARPTNASAGTANPQYVGLPNSLPVTESANYNGGQNFQSYLGVRFQANTEPAIWMTCSEVLFLKTEAAMKGYYSANAADLYNKAVSSSFRYWEATFDSTAYLSQPGVQFDGGLPKVYLQKFFSLFFCGMEAWYDYRRTGYPLLVPGPTNVNNGKIPVRIPYPLEEQSLNQANYSTQVQKMGADNINTPVWWQP